MKFGKLGLAFQRGLVGAPPALAITSPNTASVAENAALSHTLTASRPVTWSIVGGADQAEFEISGSTLRWAGNGWKDYEDPDDANGDNAYIVQVRATDGDENTVDQTITVTVTNADDTAPALSSPAGAADGATAADLSVSTNEGNGTLYWFVSGSATPPSASDLKAGAGAADAGSQAVSATGTQNAAASGLAPETTYYAHFLHRDAAGNESAIVTSESFETEAGLAEPPENLTLPEIIGQAYYETEVLLDPGGWENAESYEVRVQTDEETPVTLLDWIEAEGPYPWELPAGAIGKELILSARATGPGGVVTQDSVPFGPVDTHDIEIGTPGYNRSNTSNQTLIISGFTVEQRANRKLVAQSMFFATDGATTVTAVYGELPMTLVDSVYVVDGTRRVHLHVFELDNPPVGAADLVFDRNDTTAGRWNVTAVQLSNVQQGAPIDVDKTSGTTDTNSYASPTSALASPNDILFSFAGGEMVGTPAGGYALVKDAIMEEIAYNSLSSSPAISSINKRRPQGAGGFDAGTYTIAGGNARNLAQINVVYRAVAYVAVDAIYYVANDGDDGNDGLSFATAFKSLDKIGTLSPLAAGTEIILEDGEWHRFASRPAWGTPALDITCNGIEDAPVTIRSRNGGMAWIGGDEIITGWSSASSGETNATAAGLGAEKKTIGSTYPQMAFPCADEIMCQPAIWTRTGYPTSIFDWDMQIGGGDSYTHLSTAQVQDSDSQPAAFDDSKEMQCKAVYVSGSGSDSIYDWTVRIQHEDIAAHYGAVSPVGALCVFKTANIQNRYTVISGYDETESWIEMTYQAKGNRGPEAHSKQYWAILLHPFDLRQPGQFARIGDDLFVIWPAGTTVKSVASCERAARIKGSHWLLENVGFGRAVGAAGDEDAGSGNLAMVFDFGGDHVTWEGEVCVRQAINPARPAAIGNWTGALTNFTCNADVRTEQCYHHRGIHLGKSYGDGDGGEGIVFNGRLWLEDCGRTAFYVAGSSYGVRVNGGLYVPELAAVHGNPISSYQQSRDIQVDGVFIAGAPNFITSQKDGDPFDYPPGKGNVWGHVFGAGQRNIEASPAARTVNTPGYRIDGNDNGTVMHDVWGLSVYTTAFQFLGGDNEGFLLRRAALQSVSTPAGNGVDTTFESVIAVTGTGASTWSASGGVTVGDDSDVYSGETIYPISDGVWEFMTRKDGGGHEAKRIGPVDLGWTIPAYGGTITMVDLGLVSPTLRGTWQAHRAVGTLVKLMPASVLSLPSGVDDNDDFEIDECYLVPKVALTAGTYTITVRETNATAVNGPTRDTQLTITVIAA